MDQLNGLSYTGRIAFAEGKYEESANAYLRASDIDRFNPLVWRLLGDSRYMLKQVEPALTAYAKALEIKPGDVYAILGTLRCYVSQQRLDDALMLARNSARLTSVPSSTLPKSRKRGPAASMPRSYTLMTLLIF